MADRRPVVAGAVVPSGLWLVVAILSSGPTTGNELFRATIEAEPCRVELVNELGGVRAELSDLPDQVVAVGDPSAVAIEFSSQGGTIALRVVESVEGGQGEIEISLPPSCSAAVRTDAGSVTIDGGSEGLSYAVETVTGAITVMVDAASDAIVELATSGEITVDFSIAIDRSYHEEPAKRGEVIIGSDMGPSADRIHLSSRRGGISVLRRPQKPNGTP